MIRNKIELLLIGPGNQGRKLMVGEMTDIRALHFPAEKRFEVFEQDGPDSTHYFYSQKLTDHFNGKYEVAVKKFGPRITPVTWSDNAITE